MEEQEETKVTEEEGRELRYLRLLLFPFNSFGSRKLPCPSLVRCPSVCPAASEPTQRVGFGTFGFWICFGFRNSCFSHRSFLEPIVWLDADEPSLQRRQTEVNGPILRTH